MFQNPADGSFADRAHGSSGSARRRESVLSAWVREVTHFFIWFFFVGALDDTQFLLCVVEGGDAGSLTPRVSPHVN